MKKLVLLLCVFPSVGWAAFKTDYLTVTSSASISTKAVIKNQTGSRIRLDFQPSGGLGLAPAPILIGDLEKSFGNISPFIIRASTQNLPIEDNGNFPIAPEMDLEVTPGNKGIFSFYTGPNFLESLFLSDTGSYFPLPLYLQEGDSGGDFEGILATQTLTSSFNLVLPPALPSVDGQLWAANTNGDTYFTTIVGGIGQVADDNYYFPTTAGNLTGTGFENSGFGQAALNALTSGRYNSALGYHSLRSDTTGYANTAMGDSSQNNLLGGYENTCLGYRCLASNFHGFGNVAIGNRAGEYELGSNNFYVDNQLRFDSASAKAGALLYGTFDSNTASQTLTVNGTLDVPNILGPSAGPASMTATEGAIDSTYLSFDSLNYEVFAIFAAGSGQYFSNSFAFSFPTVTITNGTGSGDGNVVDLSWDAVAGAIGYRIIRDYNSDGYASYYDTTSTSEQDTNGYDSFSWTFATPTMPFSGSLHNRLGYSSGTASYGFYSESNGYFSGDLAVGTNNFDAKFHTLLGTRGTMAFPYEVGVFERDSDTKLGVYTAQSSLAGNGSSLTLGETRAQNAAGQLPGFEIQNVNGSVAATSYIRFNYLGRDPTSGNVVAAKTNIIQLFGGGAVTTSGGNTLDDGSGNATLLTLKDSGLTANRLVYAGTSGLLSSSASALFDATTATFTKINISSGVATSFSATSGTFTRVAIPLNLSTETIQGIDIPNNGLLTTNGARVGLVFSTYSALGTYNFATATATIAVGSSSSTITLTSSGTYRIDGLANLRYSAATFAGNQFVTLNLYRQNNTPGLIANSQSQEETQISVGALTNQFGQFNLNPIYYTTTNTNDVISLQGSISAVPGAGNFQATEASLVAQRLY